MPLLSERAFLTAAPNLGQPDKEAISACSSAEKTPWRRPPRPNKQKRGLAGDNPRAPCWSTAGGNRHSGLYRWPRSACSNIANTIAYGTEKCEKSFAKSARSCSRAGRDRRCWQRKCSQRVQMSGMAISHAIKETAAARQQQRQQRPAYLGVTRSQSAPAHNGIPSVSHEPAPI